MNTSDSRLLRVQIKQLIKENIFEIHEAFETEDELAVSRMEKKVKFNITNKEWKGWKYPYQNFVYEFMGEKYRIVYIWNHTSVSRSRKKTVKDNYGLKRKIVDFSKPPNRVKVTYLKELQITRLPKTIDGQLEELFI